MNNVVLLLVVLSAVSFGLLATAFAVIVPLAKERRRRRQRFAFNVARSNRSGGKDVAQDLQRRRIDSKMKALSERKRLENSVLGAPRRLIVRAGLDIPLGRFWGLCAVAGIIMSMLWLFEGPFPQAAPVVFVFATFLLPRTVLKRMAKKRQKKFTKHFAEGLDMITRGLQSGLPIGECFRSVAREISDPVGSEFRIIVNETNAGMLVSESLKRAYDRVPTDQLRFFATVITIQAQTGGNLSEILGNISMMLRGRQQLKETIKAKSGEAKSSAYIIGCMPVGIGALLYFINYEYISMLWTTRGGEMLFALAVFMECFGMYIMNKIADIDI